jgi:predicted nucleotidyltransferase
MGWLEALQGQIIGLDTASLSLIDLVELEHELSERLGIKVDMVIKSNLRRRIGRNLSREVILV